jgi:hypothetical protein
MKLTGSGTENGAGFALLARNAIRLDIPSVLRRQKLFET